MNFLRSHWFDMGLVLAVAVGVFVLVAHPTGIALLLWLNLIALFLHQFEEYRYPGYAHSPVGEQNDLQAQDITYHCDMQIPEQFGELFWATACRLA